MNVYMKAKSGIYNARGYFSGKQLLVLKGSRISSQSAENMRRKLGEGYQLNEKNELLEDINFSSPSSAAKFVCGRSANGWVEWKLENGDLLETVRDLSNKEICANKEESKDNFDEGLEPIPIIKHKCESYANEKNSGFNQKVDNDSFLVDQKDQLEKLEKSLSIVKAQISKLYEINYKAEDENENTVVDHIKNENLVKKGCFYIAKPKLNVPRLVCLDKKKTITNNIVKISFSNDISDICSRYVVFFLNDYMERITQDIVLNFNGGIENATFILSGKIMNNIIYLGWRFEDDNPMSIQELIPFQTKIEFANDLDF